MEKIDWDYWLKRKSLFEIEVALLTLGLDPENHQIDYLGDHYLVDIAIREAGAGLGDMVNLFQRCNGFNQQIKKVEL